MTKTILRLCEWASVSTRHRLTAEQREEIAEASRAWKEIHRLPKLPLEFGGPDGETLSARQYVGVVEAGGACIEIYPKLDLTLLDAQEVSAKCPATLLNNLLWIMEVVREDKPLEVDTASLSETTTPFLELFALLLARNLRAELMRGIVRRYEVAEDDLRAVRGRIQICQQVTRHWDRMDKIACVWDEFTPDIVLNRVLRCACRWLRERIDGTVARRLLTDCVEMLDEVDDVAVPIALSAARNLRHFDRTMERFRLSFDLAVRLLSGTGHTLQTASAETFVFLVDMNDLFERYVHSILEAVFDVRVRQQERIGYLFPHLQRGRIEQQADYYLEDRSGTIWIGDAKYKHLARGQSGALAFVAEQAEADNTPAGRLLSPDDVRQLTVYAELDRVQRGIHKPNCLMLLYPFVGSGVWKVDDGIAWNGSRFFLVPIRMMPTGNLANNFPSALLPVSGSTFIARRTSPIAR